MLYYTERIWQFDQNELLHRDGEVVIDEAACFDSEKADAGPLHIASGLNRRDVALFLGQTVSTGDAIEEIQTGYLITHAERDGSGIAVSGDMMARDPATWVNPRTINIWKALKRQEYSLEDFGLPGLQDYIDQQPERLSRRRGKLLLASFRHG